MIASQAVISGAFSVTQQAAQLGYLPQLRITHTSGTDRPGVRALDQLGAAGRRADPGGHLQSSDALAYAFGMAVTATITITTLLYFYVMRQHWQPLWLILGAPLPLLTVDLLFLTANPIKLLHGAWLPMVIAIASSPS